MVPIIIAIAVIGVVWWICLLHGKSEKSKSSQQSKHVSKSKTPYSPTVVDTSQAKKRNVAVSQVVQSIATKANSNKIIYFTTTDDKVIEFKKHASKFGANIVSCSYTNGQGVIVFDAPVVRIGDYSFEDSENLKSIVIPNGVTSIGEEAFFGCDKLESVIIPNGVTSIGEYAFSDCRSLTSVAIPDSVTSIGRAAFSGCNNLSKMIISNSVTSIGDLAFAHCRNLKEITIPNSVTLLGNQAFSQCCNIKSVTISNSITSIGLGTFNNCYSLESITIPENIVSIDEYAFFNCKKLMSVYCKRTTPPMGKSNMFLAYREEGNKEYCSINCQIYVPCNSVELFKNAEGWKDYAGAIVGYDF